MRVCTTLGTRDFQTILGTIGAILSTLTTEYFGLTKSKNTEQWVISTQSFSRRKKMLE